MWYTYVLYSEPDEIFYVGFTSDLKRRLKEHLTGSVRTTGKMKDAKLVYYEACGNEKDARERERVSRLVSEGDTLKID